MITGVSKCSSEKSASLAKLNDGHHYQLISSENIRNIRKIRYCLSLADTEKLLHAFITSKLDNTNSLLYGQPKFLIDHLQNVQNVAARVVTRTRKYDHVKPILKQLHWLPVRQRIDYRILLLTYKALNGFVAPTLWNSLPNNIRVSGSLSHFLKCIKTYLLKKYKDLYKNIPF